MQKFLGATIISIFLISMSPAHATLIENGTELTTEIRTEILMAEETSCKWVVRLVCRWEDDQKYCDRAADWICD